MRNGSVFVRSLALLALAFVMVSMVALPAVPSALAQSSTPVPLSGDPVPVGVAVAQTGGAAGFGQEQVIGAQLAEKYINDHGGINGRPLKVIIQDTASDENGAINAFNVLINTNKVYGILGPTLSQQAFAANPNADKTGVPVIAPSNTAVGIPQIGKFISRVSAPVNAVAPNAVKAALEINKDIKKVAVLFAQDDAFSKSETVIFQETVKALKLELLPVQTFSVKDTDFTTQTTAVLNAKPELVIISGLQVDGGNLVKQLRELGYKGLIIGGNGFNSPNLFPICKAQCEGILVAQAYSPDSPSDINKEFRAAYEAAQKKTPGQFTAQSFAGIQVFAGALSAVDKKTPLKDAKLEDARKALRDAIIAGTYKTPIGEISFELTKDKDGKETGGELVQKQFYVAQIAMNADGATGQFKLLKVVDAVK